MGRWALSTLGGSSRSILGASVLLSLVTGALPTDAQVDGLTFRLTLQTLGAPGTPVTVPHTADNATALEFTAYTLSVCFDPAGVIPTGVTAGADLLDATGGSVFFFVPEINVDSIAVGVVLSGVGIDTIGSGVGLELTLLAFQVSGGAVGTPAPINFCDFTSPLPPTFPHTNQLLIGGESYLPGLLIGDIPDSNPRMIRGDGNGDSNLNIADPVHTLSYLFQSGPAGPCHDSMDANDDGGVDVADAVHGLQFLFDNGSPPPSPFPTCGFDLTPDGLPCTGAGSGC